MSFATPSRAFSQRFLTLHRLELALCTLFLWPLLFVKAGPVWANMRNWHLALIPVVLAAAWKRHREHPFQEPYDNRIWKTLAIVSFASFSICVLLQLYGFHVNGMDFSIFDWMLYNTNHRAFMSSPVCDHCNHFGVHPSWIMLPLVPLHRLFESPILLQLVHALALWIAQFPLRRITERFITNRHVQFFIVWAFLVNSWTGSILNHGFHFEVFYIPLIFAMVDAWLGNQRLVFWLSLIGVLSIKEDASFYTTAFALGALLSKDARSNSWRKRTALAVIVVSVGVAFVNFKVAQPYFLSVSGMKQPHYVARFWGRYGGTNSEIVQGMIMHPHWVMGDVLTGGWRELFGSMLMLPFFTIHSLVTFVPFLLLNGTASSGDQQMRDFAFYYSSPILPFLFWGLCAGGKNVGLWFQGHLKGRLPWMDANVLIAAGALLFALNTGGYQKFPQPNFVALRDLKDVRNFIEEQLGDDRDQKVCAQLAFFPHLPYEWNLYSLSWECLEDPNVLSILGPGYDPTPHATATIPQMIDRAVIVKSFQGSGITIVRGFKKNGGG